MTIPQQMNAVAQHALTTKESARMAAVQKMVVKFLQRVVARVPNQILAL